MKLHTAYLTAITFLLGVLATSLQPVSACTGIRITAQDGSIIVARTLEFEQSTDSQILVVPRGTKYVGTAPSDQPGRRWQVKYGYVGTNGFGTPSLLDGLNERGLAAASFFFPGYAEYPEVKKDEQGDAIGPWELPSFLLGNCADVEEAIRAARSVRIGRVFCKEMDMAPPLHFIVTDASGRCAVIEPVGGELKIHDNPLGVITNAPTFDWQITNLCNYVNLTANNVSPVEMSGMKFDAFGQGSGMLGLPGDFTPPSRFIQAALFSQTVVPVPTANEGVLQAFHILNQFDIPKGSVRGKAQGKTSIDYTQWTAASDLQNRRYFFRTYENSRIRMIDLDKVDLDAENVKTISMSGEEVFENLSGTIK